ncbi:MAG TPA: penicillin-binding protein activator [Methylocella sp.]|nr:penicillin-binding protein activator [Methylocella sp.]
MIDFLRMVFVRREVRLPRPIPFTGGPRVATVLGLSLTLGACYSVTGMFGRGGPEGTGLAGSASNLEEAGRGEKIGSGGAKVALVLPMTQASGPSNVGISLRNAAELAYFEAGNNDITLLVKDDRSTPEGARAAAQSAVAEGADLIIGPLFASGAREVAPIARGAGKPVIAFSTDTSAAGADLFLLSFLIENYVDRVVDFAASKGKKSMAALIPENDYGRVAEGEFQQAAARNNVRVMTVEHYKPQTMAAAVQRIAALNDQIDAIFIPEQADAMEAMSQALVAAGANGKYQILGTGLWNDARVLNLPALQGAWFSAPENGGFKAFASRYEAKYHSDPPRIATLAYDAVSLAAALAHTQGSQRYSATVLTNKSGFNGADGVFRFRADGTNERGLAVLQINNGMAAPVSPAPHSFSGSASAT